MASKEPLPPKLVRKSVLLDADKLARARKHLGATSDAEVLRLALEHLLGHFEGFPDEEE
jgi:hypothetical protein